MKLPSLYGSVGDWLGTDPICKPATYLAAVTPSHLSLFNSHGGRDEPSPTSSVPMFAQVNPLPCAHR